MNIRFCRTVSGEVFTLYEVRNVGKQVDCPFWMVLCGRSDKRPQWKTLVTGMRGRPYFRVEGTKLYLDDFKKAV